MGMGNPWVNLSIPAPIPTETHTQEMGMGFLWVCEILPAPIPTGPLPTGTGMGLWWVWEVCTHGFVPTNPWGVCWVKSLFSFFLLCPMLHHLYS
jgi:hypothetical protein